MDGKRTVISLGNQVLHSTRPENYHISLCYQYLCYKHCNNDKQGEQKHRCQITSQVAAPFFIAH